MVLSEAGKMIEKWWAKIGKKFPSVETDEYVVMPNHFHGIVVIVGVDPRVRPVADVNTDEGAHMGAPLQRIIQWFKTMSTNEYIQRIKQNGWQTFPGKLLQRNYYEHIIRNEKELDEIRQYIVNNPLQWVLDNENPDRICL